MSDIISEVFRDSFIYLIISVILSLFISTATMLALGFECKSKGVKNEKKYMATAFFFPLVAVIIYLFNFSKYKKDAVKKDLPLRKKNEKSRNICIIVLVALFLISTVISAVYTGVAIKNVIKEAKENSITQNGETTPDGDFDATQLKMRYGYIQGDEMIFYDKFAKSYKSDLEVPFFDSRGNEYFITSNEDYEIFLTSNGVSYPYFNSYVTSEGYLIYDDDESFKIGDDEISYISDDNQRCFAAMDVSWNNQGQLVNGKGELIK